MRHGLFLFFYGIAALAQLCAGVSAADLPAKTTSEKTLEAKSPFSPEWLMTVQLGPGISPTYPGAAYYRPVPIPGISLRRADEPERFAAPDDGFGVQILDASGFRAGPVGNIVIPRWMTHDEVRGLRKLHVAIEAGVFVEYFPQEQLRLRAEVRQGFYGHHGQVGTLSLDIIEKYRAFTITSGPRLNLGTREYARPYYNVSPHEALVNGHVRPYRASGGITSVGSMTTVRYDLSQIWNVTAYGGYLRLTGSAAASPIPSMLGSRNQFTAGVLVAHTFVFPAF